VCLCILASSRIPWYDLVWQIPTFWGRGSVTATTMKIQNSHDPLPTLPFWVIHFPLLAPPNHANKLEHKHKPLLIIATILLVQEKEVLHASETYHLSFTDVYQLSIAHLVDNINTPTTRMTYKRVLSCKLSPSYKILHVVHNQHMQDK
jgi:hypothetical protein